MSPSPIDLSRVSVLCVDDDPVMRTIVRAALSQRGCRDIVQAKDGEEALDLCTGRRFDLIICDLHMEPMDGRQFLHELAERGLGGGRPVIMLSAESDTAIVAEAQAMGVGAWLAKPISARQLIEQVGAILGLSEPAADPADAAAAEHAEQQVAKLLADVAALQAVLGRPVTREDDRIAAWHGMRRRMHSMMSAADAMGYALAGVLAQRGTDLLQAAEHEPALAAGRHVEIGQAIGAIATAVRRVAENRIAGDGGETGQRLLHRLDEFVGPLRAGLVEKPGPARRDRTAQGGI
ncbi:MAG TPA: response regulator [Acetobacteraceae bacterium]|jgi:two-component system chemotaxis response regulator CheY